MFQRLNSEKPDVLTVFIDGEPHSGSHGDTVAATLLAAGKIQVRKSAVSGTWRGPYCMMGVCFECRVSIDGLSNVQGCLVAAREGMRIDTGTSRSGT